MGKIHPAELIPHYDDAASVPFTAVQVSYVAGANMKAAIPARWPTGIRPRSTLMRADQNCYVRFDDAAASPNQIVTGQLFEYRKPWETLFVVRETADGTLKVWIEG